MIKSHFLEDDKVIVKNEIPVDDAKMIWIDIVNMTKSEESFIEDKLGIDVPSYEEMQDIELSSRLYCENSSVVLVATIVAKTNDGVIAHNCTFILKDQYLVTARHADIGAFDGLSNDLLKGRFDKYTGNILLVELIDRIKDDAADMLEQIGRKMRDLSREIFWKISGDTQSNMGQRTILCEMGRVGDNISQLKDSLITLVRAMCFIEKRTVNNKEIIIMLMRDLDALVEHALSFASSVNFLLEATLGMINIEQNNIIKIFSIASIIFMPPTLIASIYGMNFANMPMLHEAWGSHMVMAAMISSAMLPYLICKYKKWL